MENVTDWTDACSDDGSGDVAAVLLFGLVNCSLCTIGTHITDQLSGPVYKHMFTIPHCYSNLPQFTMSAFKHSNRETVFLISVRYAFPFVVGAGISVHNICLERATYSHPQAFPSSKSERHAMHFYKTTVPSHSSLLIKKRASCSSIGASLSCAPVLISYTLLQLHFILFPSFHRRVVHLLGEGREQPGFSFCQRAILLDHALVSHSQETYLMRLGLGLLRV